MREVQVLSPAFSGAHIAGECTCVFVQCCGDCDHEIYLINYHCVHNCLLLVASFMSYIAFNRGGLQILPVLL